MDTPDGEHVIAWFSKAKPNHPTILYFHGNGASLAARSERISTFVNQGYGIYMMSYRGYSGSTGVPSERNNVADAKRAYDTLIAKGIGPADIVLYGESLGTGVAVQVAAKKQVSGLILDAPYTSTVDVAKICYPYLPSRLFMRDRYETKKSIGKVRAPILIVHGEQDEVVPVKMGRALAKLVTSEVKFVTFPKAGHTDHFEYGSFDEMVNWLQTRARLKEKSSASGSAA